MKYKSESLFTKYQIPPTKSVNELRVLFQTDPNKRKDLPVVIKTISNPEALLEEELFTPHCDEGNALKYNNIILYNLKQTLDKLSDTSVNNVLSALSELIKLRDNWCEFNYFNVVDVCRSFRAADFGLFNRHTTKKPT